jgi:hypothetical protein
MSKTYADTNYGTRRPDAIEKHPDQVVLNTNIREVPYTDAETGETVMTYIADAQMMTYQEYSTVQDLIITQQGITITEQGVSLAHEASANAEQDELIALILEGGI